MIQTAVKGIAIMTFHHRCLCMLVGNFAQHAQPAHMLVPNKIVVID